MTYLVSSPYGPLTVASWSCTRCPAGDGEAHREPGDDGGAVRDRAAAHLARTGHGVTFRRGTAEMLVPVATEPAETAPQ